MYEKHLELFQRSNESIWTGGYIAFMRREAELYSKYKQYYGYVFYIGKKI
jgi:hypothetical protein